MPRRWSPFCVHGHFKQGRAYCPVCRSSQGKVLKARENTLEQQWLTGPYPGLYPELARKPWVRE